MGGPTTYYSSHWGDADRLPNGNRLGTFGARNHPNTHIGARLVEVNKTGHIVWEMNFAQTVEFLYGVYRMERFRFSPIISSPQDIKAYSTDNVKVSWQTCYNFRSKRHFTGSYVLYLDNKRIDNGTHVFNKFWQPKNLSIDLGKLEIGTHNLTLVLADEAGHSSKDSIIIQITDYSITIAPILFSFLMIFGGCGGLLIWHNYYTRGK